ncbi:MAG: FAD-dependent oxidoreductase, partial [Polyangiaceae bacterium]
MKRIERVLVVGGGSAGFLAALALRSTHPDLAITLVKSESIPIIGVGEATTWRVPDFLHNFLGLDRKAFFREAHPTWKGSVRLLFGRRPHFDYTFEYQMSYRPAHRLLRKNAAYYCFDDFRTASLVRATMDRGLSPIIRMPSGDFKLAASIGYHVENETFVAHLERRAVALGVEVAGATIEGFEKDPAGNLCAARIAGGGVIEADLFVDCSGFRSRLLREEMGVPFRSFATSLFCDRAIVGGWPRGADEPVRPFTSAVTMRAGWTFLTEHWERKNCGYVFSSAFISDEEAERELRAWAGGRLGAARVVPYVSGRYERAWERNVVAIGNSCGFVEPLQSTGLHVICDMAAALAGILIDSDRAPNEGFVRHFNRLFADSWDEIRAFLALHYQLNDRLETPLWHAARA